MPLGTESTAPGEVTEEQLLRVKPLSFGPFDPRGPYEPYEPPPKPIDIAMRIREWPDDAIYEAIRDARTQQPFWRDKILPDLLAERERRGLPPRQKDTSKSKFLAEQRQDAQAQREYAQALRAGSIMPLGTESTAPGEGHGGEPEQRSPETLLRQDNEPAPKPNTDEAIKFLRYWHPEPWPVSLFAYHLDPATGAQKNLPGRNTNFE